MDIQKAQQTQVNFSATKRKDTATRTSSSTTTTNLVTVTLPLLCVYILLISLLAEPANGKYTLYKPKPGIHVEHIGTGKIRRGSFRIDIPYNYTKLTEDISSISNRVQQMNRLCKDIQYQIGEDSCSNLILRLLKLEAHIIRMKTDLDSYIGYERHDGTGKFLKALLSADNDGYLDISKLKTKEEELVDDSENILLSTVSVLREKDMELTAMHENFENTLRTATDSLNIKSKTSVISHKNQLQMHFLSLYETTSVYISQIINHYTKLSKIQRQQGNLYDILSLDRVTEIISSAMKKLPSNLAILPKPILEIKIRRDGDTVYIHGYFPVIDNNDFTLLEIIAVPLEIKNNSYLMFDIPNKIIAIDYDKQLYFNLSDEELSNSVQLQDNIYLCTPKVIKKMQDYPICVLDHIYERSKNKTCEPKRNNITSIIWKELYTKNAWMFITNKPANVAVLCNNNREDITIDKSGILKIPHNCVIRNKRSILSPKMKDDTYASFIKDVPAELNKPIPQLSSNNLQDALKEPVNKVIDMLKSMNGEVAQVQSQLRTNDGKDKQQGVFGHVIAGLSVVSVIIVALVSYRTSDPFWKIILDYICMSQISSEPNENTRLLQNS